MSLVLSTNYSSLVAQNSLSTSGGQLATALQQLSSGLRINTAADDAAGYAITQGMTSQINGLGVAARNANDGVSLTQTGSGALTEIVNDLQTMRDLAVQSLNATNSAQDRADLNQQFQQLSADIDNVAKTTNFNGVNLLDGTFQGSTFQIGPNAGQTITVSSVASARTSALGTSFSASLGGGAITAGTPLAAGDLSFQVGSSVYAVGAAVNGSNGQTSDSAYAIANAINATSAGITATAAANVWTSAAAPTGVGANATAKGTFTINGATVTIAAGDLGNGAATDAAKVANDINAVSAVSGVSASLNASSELVLTAQDGRNISVGAVVDGGGTTALTAALLGTTTFAGNTQASTISLSSSQTFTVGGNNPTHAGASLTGGTVVAVAATGTSIANADVLTVSGSNAALSSIDSAIQAVSATGAQLGAYQNRFQAAITGLNTDSTNLQSARSGIQDTDYAAATSALSKAQILQQASTAMVAQANTIPQNILTLLQKLP
jgi:flagellin